MAKPLQTPEDGQTLETPESAASLATRASETEEQLRQLREKIDLTRRLTPAELAELVDSRTSLHCFDCVDRGRRAVLAVIDEL
jgi:hypothetical protein